jgi:hypothetical protein
MEDKLATTVNGITTTTTVELGSPDMPTTDQPMEATANNIVGLVGAYIDAQARRDHARRAMYAWETRENQIGELIRSFLGKHGMTLDVIRSLAEDVPF